MENNRICIICGKKYSYCPHCGKYDNVPRWMMSFHDENCMKIYSITWAYKNGKMSKDNAKEELAKINVFNGDGLRDGIKSLVDEILQEISWDEIKVIPKVQDEVVDEEQNPVISKKQNHKRNRNKG